MPRWIGGTKPYPSKAAEKPTDGSDDSTAKDDAPPTAEQLEEKRVSNLSNITMPSTLFHKPSDRSNSLVRLDSQKGSLRGPVTLSPKLDDSKGSEPDTEPIVDPTGTKLTAAGIEAVKGSVATLNKMRLEELEGEVAKMKRDKGYKPKIADAKTYSHHFLSEPLEKIAAVGDAIDADKPEEEKLGIRERVEAHVYDVHEALVMKDFLRREAQQRADGQPNFVVPPRSPMADPVLENEAAEVLEEYRKKKAAAAPAGGATVAAQDAAKLTPLQVQSNKGAGDGEKKAEIDAQPDCCVCLIQ